MSLSFFTPTNAIRVPGISCIGARIYFGNVSSLQVMPEDLLAGGELKPSKLPALRPSTPLSGGPSLTFAPSPMSWQGEQNRLKTCSPAAASCAKVVPVEAARAIPAITHVLIIFSCSRQYGAPVRRPPRPDGRRPDETRHWHQLINSDPNVRM